MILLDREKIADCTFIVNVTYLSLSSVERDLILVAEMPPSGLGQSNKLSSLLVKGLHNLHLRPKDHGPKKREERGAPSLAAA